MKTDSTTLLEPGSETLTRAASRSAAPSRPKRSFLARQVIARLDSLSVGTLTLEHAGARQQFGVAAPDAPDATLTVQDERFWFAVATRGSVGAGEAFAKGWWTSHSPTDVVRLFVRNQSALEGLEGGAARLSLPLLKAYHALRRNTEAGSRANISAHYDLSNDFFRLFLDETMTYSCGIFEREDATLREASIAKIDRLCRKLELRPSDHLLEIGTGWGAFAVHAAREYGCRVTTTTISREQHALAAERIRAAGLEDRVTLLFEDYRRLEGSFDKLVSVEMIEAVGARYFDAFFEQCGRLLAPDGLMALQAITIADQHYEAALRSVDFIQRYIFPGCCIPSVSALCTSIACASDLKPVHMEDIGPHYERTLRSWRENLLARRADALALGYDDELLRLWEFYFAYCEGGYAERRLGDVQLVLAKPGARQAPLLSEL
jgi:cyclopropane-fatty-acyl-phospholipid synthase